MKFNLKKSLFIIAILFTAIMGVKKVNAATLNYDFTGYWFERFDQNGGNYASWKLNNYYIDGNVAYCIEPGVEEGNPIYEGSWANTGLSNDLKERTTLIAYYGYTYPSHQTQAYRAATQALIWKNVLGNGTTVRYSTERYYNETPFNVSNEEAEIERLIANHYTKPSFNGGTYTLQVGETITLTDTNGVLSNFNVSVSGADYSVNGNNLTITPTSDGSITITMRKNMPYQSAYRIFYGNDVQNMLVPGTTDPVVSQVRVNAYYGRVEINKKDVETGSNAQGQATLKGAEYGVYNLNDELITTITTDESGYAKSDNVLKYGTYYLKEIKASEGYYLDNTKYTFDSKAKELVSQEVYERVVKNYISILKQYDYVDGNTTFLNAERNIVFEIYYPNGDKWGEIKTDKNGYATIDLPYGVWKFHQVNTDEYFDKIYDFNLTVNYDTELEQYYNILNNKITAYLQVFKTDSETGETIALANTKFKIFSVDKNEYVSQYVGGKIYNEFETDEEGKFITYLKLEAGNYKLIEITSPKGYLLDQDGLDFKIGNDTYYNYTTYGAFITVYFKDDAIKGQIEIIKNGEVFNIEDGTFNYNERTTLEGIKYNIYALEDIKSSDGNYIYYNEGDLVATITTNSDGYAISDRLPLGKYKVVEIETNDDYVIDEIEYQVELTEIDNRTAIVYSKLEMTNNLKKANVEITKTDLVNGDVIPNTILEIYTENDELIFAGKTDSEGKIIIENLKLGKYYIVEKESATGYVITDEKVYFELKENGEIVKAKMKNKPITSTVEITKIDISTSEPLPNTLIEVYNDKDELVYSGRTNEEGIIIIEDLRYGKYYFIEKEAPEGYQLNSEKMYFEVLEDGEIIKCTMKDEKIVVEVPNTLKYDYMPFVMFGVSVVGLGAVAYGIKKSKKTKKK